MSRGFVKEEDQEEPPFVPPRAALPPGVDNYVTQEGYDALLKEREKLVESKKSTRSLSDRDRRRENTVIDVKIRQIDERIDTAQVIDPIKDPTEVRFGVSVQFKPTNPKGPSRTFKIVGVDEANIRDLTVAFIAPIVQAMMGKKAGDEFFFSQGEREVTFTIEKIQSSGS